MPATQIEGQLNATERRLLTEALTHCLETPKVGTEVSLGLGGRRIKSVSTCHEF